MRDMGAQMLTMEGIVRFLMDRHQVKAYNTKVEGGGYQADTDKELQST